MAENPDTGMARDEIPHVLNALNIDGQRVIVAGDLLLQFAETALSLISIHGCQNAPRLTADAVRRLNLRATSLTPPETAAILDEVPGLKGFTEGIRSKLSQLSTA